MNRHVHNVQVSTDSSLSLGTVGLITWIVFMIMDYGCHMDWIVNANNTVKEGGHFWTWFPLWAPAALGLALAIIAAIITVIVVVKED